MTDEPGRPEPAIADDEGLQAFVAVAAELTDEDSAIGTGEEEKQAAAPAAEQAASPTAKAAPVAKSASAGALSQPRADMAAV